MRRLTHRGRERPSVRTTYFGGDMNHLLCEQLENVCNELTKLICETESFLQSCPPGRLKCCNRKNRIEYYWKESSTGKAQYINSRNRNLAPMLAQKEYNRQILKAAQEQRKAIRKLIKVCHENDLDTITSSLPKYRRQLIRPYRLTDEEYRNEWLKQESCMLAFGKEDPEFRTIQGERVRSKSEVFLADLMHRLDVPYLYERSILLPGYGTTYPDFTVLNVRKRKVIIWEHFGMMDDPEYVDKCLRKLNYYLKAGYILGDTLLITFETRKRPLNMPAMEAMVKKHFL